VDLESSNQPADNSSNAAKIADWLAQNPASLAALIGLSSGQFGVGGAGNLDGYSFTAQQLAVAGGGAVQPGSTVKALDGGKFLSAINGVGDAQSLAAALTAVVAQHALTARIAGDGSPNPQKGSLASAGAATGQAVVADLLSGAVVPAESNPQAFASTESKAATSVSRSSFELFSFANGLVKIPVENHSSLEPDGSVAGFGSQIPAKPMSLIGLDGSLASSADASSSNVSAFAGIERSAETLRRLNSDDRLGLRSDSVTALPSTSMGFDTVSSAGARGVGETGLGQASSANARNLEGTISWLASQQGGSATIDLTPPELGSLRLELKIDSAGESATLIVHAASDVAQTAIEHSLDRLYESFQSAGIALHVSVGGGFSQSLPQYVERFSSSDDGALNRSLDRRPDSLTSTTLKAASSSDGLSVYA
jgi:flagellar hook-length control protein FliK